MKPTKNSELANKAWKYLSLCDCNVEELYRVVNQSKNHITMIAEFESDELGTALSSLAVNDIDTWQKEFVNEEYINTFMCREFDSETNGITSYSAIREILAHDDEAEDYQYKYTEFLSLIAYDASVSTVLPAWLMTKIKSKATADLIKLTLWLRNEKFKIRFYRISPTRVGVRVVSSQHLKLYPFFNTVSYLDEVLVFLAAEQNWHTYLGADDSSPVEVKSSAKATFDSYTNFLYALI